MNYVRAIMAERRLKCVKIDKGYYRVLWQRLGGSEVEIGHVWTERRPSLHWRGRSQHGAEFGRENCFRRTREEVVERIAAFEAVYEEAQAGPSAPVMGEYEFRSFPTAEHLLRWQAFRDGKELGFVMVSLRATRPGWKIGTMTEREMDPLYPTSRDALAALEKAVEEESQRAQAAYLFRSKNLKGY